MGGTGCDSFCGTTVPITEIPWKGGPISQCDWEGWCDKCPPCNDEPVAPPTSAPVITPTSSPVTSPTTGCMSFCGTTVPLSDVPWTGAPISQCDWTGYCDKCEPCVNKVCLAFCGTTVPLS